MDGPRRNPHPQLQRRLCRRKSEPSPGSGAHPCGDPPCVSTPGPREGRTHPHSCRRVFGGARPANAFSQEDSELWKCRSSAVKAEGPASGARGCGATSALPSRAAGLRSAPATATSRPAGWGWALCSRRPRRAPGGLVRDRLSSSCPSGCGESMGSKGTPGWDQLLGRCCLSRDTPGPSVSPRHPLSPPFQRPPPVPGVRPAGSMTFVGLKPLATPTPRVSTCQNVWFKQPQATASGSGRGTAPPALR